MGKDGTRPSVPGTVAVRGTQHLGGGEISGRGVRRVATPGPQVALFGRCEPVVVLGRDPRRAPEDIVVLAQEMDRFAAALQLLARRYLQGLELGREIDDAPMPVEPDPETR